LGAELWDHFINGCTILRKFAIVFVITKNKVQNGKKEDNRKTNCKSMLLTGQTVEKKSFKVEKKPFSKVNHSYLDSHYAEAVIDWINHTRLHI